MKKVILTLSMLLFVTFSLLSQDIYAPMSNFTDDEAEQISKAKDLNERGNKMMSNADNEYNQYKDLFTSGKKGKIKKAEAKTVPAKKNMISAGNYYLNGYQILYDLYTTKLNTLTFEFDEDKQKAAQLQQDAQKKFDAGKKILQNHQKHDEKDLKSNITFSQLAKDIKNGQQKLDDAVSELAQALNLYENQNIKKQQLADSDNNAWRDALMKNSIEGYQGYIDNFANGMHVAESNQKITELEQKIKDAELQQKNPNLIYHIQIMADKKQWSISDIKSKIYFTNEPITEQFFDGWYKYWIGNFKTYEEAKKYLQNNVRPKRKGAFVVGTVNGVFVEIKNALDIQDKSNK